MMKHDLTQDNKTHIILAVLLTALTFAVYYKILGHNLLMNCHANAIKIRATAIGSNKNAEPELMVSKFAVCFEV